MAEQGAESVGRALQALLVTVDTRLEAVNTAGAGAFELGDYDAAQHSLEEAAMLRALRRRAEGLYQDWREFQMTGPGPARGLLLLSRQRPPRLRPGERTAESEYYLPILAVLDSVGGAGRSNEILDLVEEHLRGSLREVDYQATRSNPRTPRWRVTAQRARNTLAARGLLNNDAPRGVWELTDAGRAWMAEQHTEAVR